MLRAAFGEAVVDHYVHAAEWEQSEYDRRITDWELKRGFERGLEPLGTRSVAELENVAGPLNRQCGLMRAPPKRQYWSWRAKRRHPRGDVIAGQPERSLVG